MRIHLVDGTYELFRAWFGAPEAKAPDGREVGATRGLLASLYSLLRQEDVTHVAVAFDTVVESFRNDLFDGYKTGEGLEPELYQQFPLGEEATAALGIPVWSMVEFEADDGLASGAARFADAPGVEQVLLCSPDKDLCQCVSGESIVTFDRKNLVLRDEAGVWEKFGVAPLSIPDYLALVGDTADGIPGIPRWGAKSASTVLGHYGSLERIPEDEGQWEVKVRGAKALNENLRAQWDDALLYRKLAVLRTDAPVSESLDELHWQGVDRPRLEDLCARLGFERFLDRLD